MYITNIQRFSLDDGPGIRTTIFLAGCNMRCKWCHNPENLEMRRQRTESDKDGNVIEIFNSQDISVKKILEGIIKDKKYYAKSGGGITVSGGEPLCQLDEVRELLRLCKEHEISTAIETALNYKYSDLEQILPYTDLVIADCKAVTESIHISCTGVSNKQILENICKMSSSKIRFWIRIPVIPEVNITMEEIRHIGEFLKDKQAEIIELIPYHMMGISKYKLWGYNYLLDNVKVPDTDYMKACFISLQKICNNVVWQE